MEMQSNLPARHGLATHAEKTACLDRYAGYQHKARRQGGYMATNGFLSSITLCDLAYAYSLQYKQCRSIVKSLPAQFPCNATTLAELDALAEDAAQIKNCLSLLLDEVLDRVIKVTSIMRPDIYLHYIQNNILFFCGNELEPVLEEVFRAYLLGVTRINKKESVIFLHENDFILVNPFFELSREYVGKIIGNARKKINIPPSVFTGKDIYAAYEALKETYTDRRIMAAILQKVGGTKTDIGRLIYVPERYKNDDGREPDNATCFRAFNKLIKECEKNFIITFMEKN